MSEDRRAGLGEVDAAPIDGPAAERPGRAMGAAPGASEDEALARVEAPVRAERPSPRADD